MMPNTSNFENQESTAPTDDSLFNNAHLYLVLRILLHLTSQISN